MHLGDRLLCAVASTLEQLPWKVVYLGGSTTHLHLTDPSAAAPELTDDVDAVVEVSSPVEFQIQLREKLRELGAKEDTSEDAPTCRWLLGGLKVDIMSPNEEVLGFSNRWYRLALATARRHELPDGKLISVICAPVFLATKLEAYGDRGKDCLSSKDVEDLIAVIDGRPQLAGEYSSLPVELRAFVADSLNDLRSERDFEYAVQGYLREFPERSTDVHDQIDQIITACQSSGPAQTP